MSCDPNFANVSLLLHCDGTNGSTVFPDSSGNASPITSSGVTVDTATPEFGTGAALMSTGSAFNTLSTPITAAGPLDMQAQDFTAEGWLNVATPNSCLLISSNTTSGIHGGFEVTAALGGTNTLGFRVTIGGVGYTASSPTFAATPGTWYSWAAVRQGTALRVYLNGVAGSPGACAAGAITSDTDMVIGGIGSLGFSLIGQVDEIRLTKGLARYTSNYTPVGPFGELCFIVPNVIGETLAAAEVTLAAASLAVGTLTYDFSDPANVGLVILQNPAAGSSATIGEPVDMTVEGTVVPDVTNLSLPIAQTIIVSANLIVGVVSYQPSGIIISGNVISQTPVGGSGAVPESPVSLVISTGLPSLTVPDLFGLTQTDAINLLLSLGLVPGAIGSAPSKFVPPGEVQAQNPNAGEPVAVGTIVSFVLSLGIPAVGVLFDFEATVISQYANSPTIMQLVQNLNQYIDQSANFANFYNFVWNVDTAVGFGLDIWGKIVGVSRLLQIPNSTPYVGFYQSSESQPAQDWTPAGSSQPPYNNPPVGGAFYTGHNATDAYLLPDDSYRQLILAKAFANICTTTAPAINQILQNLYGAGTAFVLNTGPMAISYNLTFTPTPIQLAILEQSGVIPTPPGVSVTINTNV